MAHRKFECPVPRISEVPETMVLATVRLEAAALKWRALAERRRDHHIELYRTGRWRHYFTDQEFVTAMRTAVALVERWAKIAPRPEEREAAGSVARDRARTAELVMAVDTLSAKAA